MKEKDCRMVKVNDLVDQFVVVCNTVRAEPKRVVRSYEPPTRCSNGFIKVTGSDRASLVEEIASLEIVCKPTNLRLPKSFLPPAFSNNKKIELNGTFPLRIGTITKALLGMPFKVVTSEIVSMFQFFKYFGMTDYGRAALAMLEQAKEEELVNSFLENQDEGASERIKSILVQKLWSEKKLSRTTMKTLESHGLLSELVLIKPTAQKYESSFEELHALRMEKLEGSRKEGSNDRDGANIVLLSSEGVRVTAHVEVLVRNSNLFYHLLSFPGKELNDFEFDRTLKLEGMNFNVLQRYVQYLYLGKLGNDEKFVDLALLEHSAKYFEFDLKENLSRSIGYEMKRYDAYIPELLLLYGANIVSECVDRCAELVFNFIPTEKVKEWNLQRLQNFLGIGFRLKLENQWGGRNGLLRPTIM